MTTSVATDIIMGLWFRSYLILLGVVQVGSEKIGKVDGLRPLTNDRERAVMARHIGNVTTELSPFFGCSRILGARL